MHTYYSVFFFFFKKKLASFGLLILIIDLIYSYENVSYIVF